ncbi:MAG TPA: hypothetical protein VHR45_11990 [Thermoanaerobaculia bacterium]|nr:hypothetical protein [Thermoanaerobaculia bacterium]
MIAVLVLATIAIHEGAHVVVGAWVGFRLSSMRVGRIQIGRPFRISIYRGAGAGAGGWLGGWANLLPVKTERLVPRAVAMVLAGPTANLLSGCAVLLLPYSKGFASDVFVLFSLVQGSVNLVPYRYKAVLSDGARILMLLGNRERGERWLAAMKLVAELRAGVPPESLSADFLAKAVAVRDDSPDTVGAHAIAYTAALGQRKDAEAAQHLETCLEYSGFAAPAVRQALMSDAAVFQALSRKRADLAERWLAAMPKKIESPSMRTRAEAAILQAKGDAEGALRKLDEMESSLLAEPDETRREISRRSLARWKSALRARGGSDGLPK